MDSAKQERLPEYRWSMEGCERVEESRSRREKNEPRGEPEPCRLLIVEDDPSVREALQVLLGDGRHEVIALGDGRHILEMLEGYRPKLIILDIHLPGPDGFSICKTVRSSPAFRHIPVLFLTVQRDDESFVKSLNVNGDAYLTKPFQPQELRETIERLTLPA